jgi:hypothetical protein
MELESKIAEVLIDLEALIHELELEEAWGAHTKAGKIYAKIQNLLQNKLAQVS